MRSPQTWRIASDKEDHLRYGHLRHRRITIGIENHLRYDDFRYDHSDMEGPPQMGRITSDMITSDIQDHFRNAGPLRYAVHLKCVVSFWTQILALPL